MALDQSIFTNSEAIAEAIYYGTFPDEAPWSEAFFSPINLMDEDGWTGWTGIDMYAKNRLAQWGDICSYPEADGLSIGSLDFVDARGKSVDIDGVGSAVIVGCLGETIDPAERAAHLKVMKRLGTVGSNLAGHPFYQIGLFSKFNGLHGWFQKFVKRDGMELTNDGYVVFTDDVLYCLGRDALRVLETFDEEGQAEGELVAKELFPTVDGFFFGSTEYDEAYLGNLANLFRFCYTILGFDGVEDALFVYNPWW